MPQRIAFRAGTSVHLGDGREFTKCGIGAGILALQHALCQIPHAGERIFGSSRGGESSEGGHHQCLAHYTVNSAISV